jgi:hypothetical protein
MCPACGGVNMIARIEDPVVIDKILTHLNEKAASTVTGLLPEKFSEVRKRSSSLRTILSRCRMA